MRSRATLRPLSVGAEARDALRSGRAGRVEAVFARSFYVRLGDDWICIGEPALGRGPLNLLLDRADDWLREVRLHAPAVTAHDILRLGDVVLDLGGAAPWRPDPAPGWTPESLAAGLVALCTARPEGIPQDGLAAFIHPGAAPSTRTARAARPAIEALSHWLTERPGTTCPSHAVRALLGLGPGLTPSGDDYLAGATTTLRAIGCAPMADALWAEIERHAPHATTALSVAHLRAANRFGLGERLHTLLIDILTGWASAVRSGLAALASGASNSPWDTLAGCAAVLRIRSRASVFDPAPTACAEPSVGQFDRGGNRRLNQRTVIPTH